MLESRASSGEGTHASAKDGRKARSTRMVGAETAQKKKASSRKRAPRKGEQLALPRTGGWGGKRRNAGRKRRDPEARSQVAHVKRPAHKGRHPVHVTLRAKSGLPSFRQQRVQRLLAEVLRDQRRRRYEKTFRVVHYSIQGNHLHLIVEADTERAVDSQPLRSGVSGLAIAFARRLNMMLRRKGKVWEGRYHRHDLKTPKETWVGLRYVFDNFTHHGQKSYGDGVLDLYSTAWLFDGWGGPHVVFDESERWRWFACHARTWLVRCGYLLHGRLPLAPRR